MAKTFDFNHNYLLDKPAGKRTAAYDKWWFFQFKQRNGNEVTFSNRDKFDLKDYKGKVLTNPKTGDEICFIIFGMDKYMLDAKYYISAGRPISKETLDATVESERNDEKQEFTKTAECGMTLGEFLEKKAKKIK